LAGVGGRDSADDMRGETGAELSLPDGRRIAYRQRAATELTRGCTGIMFLCGFRSDMTGTKASLLDSHCAARGLGFLRFDYSGHGRSSGEFTDGTIGRWTEEAVAVMDHAGDGPLILVGSSMGGWIMLLAALARPQRVAGLIGLAPAPDFTERLIWDALPEAQRAEMMTRGRLEMPSQYADTPTILTRDLIEEGRRHLLLSAPVALRCPVRLLHGMADPDVPHALSLELAERLISDDVRVTLIKDGDHRLSRPQDLALLTQAVDELSQPSAARIAGNPSR
jgi:pimeloyl-ACP methyl ester carboxylesterase